MARTRFDQFSKQLLDEFLTPLGTVETSLEIPGEPRLVDLYFAPSPQPQIDPQTLGLLGRIAETPCLFEPFRNPPKPSEVRDCLLKLFWVHAEFQRQANRDDRRLSETELPQLWILASSASESLLSGFATSLNEDWLPGIYFMGASFKGAIVAINQLPRSEETLWLRLLGKGSTQTQAISEVLAIPASDPRRMVALQLLSTWKITLETSGLIDEDREVFMALSQAYLEWEARTKQQARQEGRQEGRQEEQRVVIESLLKIRFGAVDEQLATIVPALLELPTEEYTQLLLQASREELIDRFQRLG
jgi:hypothetical protein